MPVLPCIPKSLFAPRPCVLLAAAVASALQVTPAGAQDLVLEEVVVTARKRAESLQETPVAVTALDASALRDAGVRNLADLNQIAPSIDVASANGNAPLANVYIRGVGQRNSGANIDSGVGIYIDEVYVGRPDGALLDLNDVQSVQVLRGPQGTLFGKNTTGGALVFTTNKPTDVFEGSVGMRVGNLDRLDGDFVVNVPVTDTLWTRLSGVARSRDGYIDNLFDGENYMDEDRQSLVWQTRFVPTDDLTLDLNLNWAKTDQTMRPQKCQLVPSVEGWQAAVFNTLAIVPATGKTVDEHCQEAAEAGDGNTVISDLGGDYESENKGASLTAEWAINDSLSLKSITAWRYTEASQNDELDHIGVPFLHRTNSVHPSLSGPAETDQYSQELQLVGSAFDERLQYVTGLYWFSEETQGRINLNYLGPFDPAIGNLFFLNATATGLAADNSAWAAFSQVEWEFNDNWRATLGLRYTDEERELERVNWNLDPATLDANGGPVVALGGGLFSVQRPSFEYNPDFDMVVTDRARGKTDNSDVTPMASLQYLMGESDWIDQGSLYLTYSEGFLSGGLSEAPTGDLEEFEPEEVENWELGFKLDLLERRLRINGALFSTDYTNRQLTTLVINPQTNSPTGATINAAKSSIDGLELETTWLATRNLLVTFNMTLADGDIQEFDDTQLQVADTTVPPPPGCTRANLTLLEVDACPKDRSDENLPRLAEQTYMLAAQYTLETGVGVFMPRVQASWKLDMDFCFDATSCESGLWFEDEQFELSARLTWISNDERWVGSLYGTNLTDEEYIVGGTALVESEGVGGVAYAPPRMYGAELEYRF
ncbi:TonB-dependent receptor [Parahaliea mediterranea]|uniref:TonB-dependent receptor n=1 Tax=Parahaliea mediterranea TaxID=651086 RepID=A0A939INU1_9GAMM|nr:TonB-dependent receptor [Parahaliea mediterranea]MBN7798900.1 TonB-dependent receptor [Parahaliea mediterranea]